MNIDRRNFLLYAAIALTSASAYSFGEEIKSLIDEKTQKIALIYGTRYGATKDTARFAEYLQELFFIFIAFINIFFENF